MMNDIDRAKVQAWLTSKGVTKCPACGGGELKATNVVGSLSADTRLSGVNTDAPQTYTVDTSKMPYAVHALVGCTACAHVMHFDARAVGLKIQP